jgi:hypothetical protein
MALVRYRNTFILTMYISQPPINQALPFPKINRQHLKIPRRLRHALRSPSIISILLLRSAIPPTLPTLRLHRRRHLQLGLLTRVMPRPDRGYEINRKTPHVECVDERDDPLADCSAVVVFSVAEDAEGNGEPELDQDEG